MVIEETTVIATVAASGTAESAQQQRKHAHHTNCGEFHRLSSHLKLLTLIFAALLAVSSAACASVETFATNLASLVDPAKLSTLGSRGANPRIQKAVALLADAESNNLDSATICAAAIKQVEMKPAAGELTKSALLRNLDIARKLGCLDTEGLNEMRHGKAATIRKGPYKGDQLSVDHIIPRAVAPELDNVIANLELMPLRMNQSKNDKVGARQIAMAEKFRAAGLLSATGLKAVKGARKP